MEMIAPRQQWPLSEIAVITRCPDLSDLVAYFLYDQHTPNAERSGAHIDISQCPNKFMGKVYSYTSAIATFYAPSDLSRAGGMYRQCIHASPSWHNGPKWYDCVYVERDPTLSGFQGLFVAKVLHFFDFEFRNRYYPCALVHWFDSIGDQPCPNTGMWMVQPEYNGEGEPTFGLYHAISSFDCHLWYYTYSKGLTL